MLASGDVVLLVLGGAAVLVAVVLAAALVARRRSSRPSPAPEPITHEEEHMPLAAVVVNPTKVDDLAATRALITRICTEHGWSEPLWLETTEDDPGAGQTRQALASGADVVMAHGGDGTVRSVAEVLAGSGTALGLLPAGTGNLLARNMEATLDDIAGSVRIALTGDDRPVDVGWMRLDGKDDERAFLVMAGFGFDAEIMANAPEGLKAKVGPAAYVVSGLARFNGPRVRVRLQIDDGEPISRRVRTVVIGNCGKLLGGVVLMPDAELDDGVLDVVSIAPTGVVGWAAVAGRVITRQRRGHERVEHWRGRSMTFLAEQPLEAQLDGDPIGEAARLDVRVDHGALLVRVPVGGGRGETPAATALKRAAGALVPDLATGRRR